MNILYILHFNAPMGGLHENLYSSALFMNNKNHNVWVVLKEGPLAERLRSNDIHTIIVDYKYISQTLQKIADVSVEFDIIHTHPGPSRKAALHYSKQNNIPLVMTFHGMWSDSLKLYNDKITAVICVSEGVKDFVKSQTTNIDDKCFIIPNGYDSVLFNEPVFYTSNNKKMNIGLVTRLDQDKKFILDIFLIALKHLSKSDNYQINFQIIGEGELKNSFLEECRDILLNTNHSIQFNGWLVDKQLKDAYQACDIIFAPGRSAIESMACGKPTISVGSKKYIGLIKHDNWKQGVYNNFGGYGNKFNDYLEGTVEKELDMLLKGENNINLLGKFSYDIASKYYDSSDINNKLLKLYHTIILEKEIESSFSGQNE